MPIFPDISFGLLQLIVALFFAVFVPEWLAGRVDKGVDRLPLIGKINIAFKKKVLKRVLKDRYNPKFISRVICGYILSFLLGGVLLVAGLLL